MTTEVRNYYHPAAYPQDLGVITAKPFERPDGSTCAIIDLASDLHHPRAGSLWIDDRARARELLAAAFEALRILDPDGAVIVRASNQEIYLLEEILPGSEVTDPWQPPRAVAGPPVDLGDDPDGDSTPEPAPFTSPDLVIPPDAQPHLPDGSPNPYQTHSAASGITAPVETGEPWRG